MRLWGRTPAPLSVEDDLMRAIRGHLDASVRHMRTGMVTAASIALDQAERLIVILREYRAGTRHLVAVPKEWKK